MPQVQTSRLPQPRANPYASSMFSGGGARGNALSSLMNPLRSLYSPAPSAAQPYTARPTPLAPQSSPARSQPSTNTGTQGNTTRGLYGTIQHIGGGTVYSDPRDNPNRPQPSTSTPPTGIPSIPGNNSYTPPNNPTSSPVNVPPPANSPPPVNQPPAPPQSLYGQYTTQLADSSQKPGKAYVQAKSAYDKALEDLKNFDVQTNKAISGTYQERIPLQFEQGRAQVVANQAAANRGALSNVVTGASNALSAANTQQGLQQSALGTALGAAGPRQQGYVLIDPITGQPIGGQESGLNAAQRGGQYSAAESGGQNYYVNNQQLTGAQNQVDSLSQLINSAHLNNLGINLANATIQKLQQNLSSSDYATLQNTLQSINAALTRVTGSPVDVAQISTQRGESLITTIRNALQAARAQNEGYRNTGGASGGGGGPNDPLGIRI